jgi:hypothetical protein
MASENNHRRNGGGVNNNIRKLNGGVASVMAAKMASAS